MASTWFAPILTGHGAFRDVYNVMNHWGVNHGAIGFVGHLHSIAVNQILCLSPRAPLHQCA